MAKSTIILNHLQIEQKLERIAWQINEEFCHENELVIIGVQEKGCKISDILETKLKAISSLHILVGQVKVNKNEELPGNAVLISEFSLKNKSVVIVDDVLNSGKTLLMALLPIISQNPASIKTVILADRNHKQFPVATDIVGISLATTLQEHIQFNISELGEMSVMLN